MRCQSRHVAKVRVKLHAQQAAVDLVCLQATGSVAHPRRGRVSVSVCREGQHRASERSAGGAGGRASYNASATVVERHALHQRQISHIRSSGVCEVDGVGVAVGSTSSVAAASHHRVRHHVGDHACLHDSSLLAPSEAISGRAAKMQLPSSGGRCRGGCEGNLLHLNGRLQYLEQGTHAVRLGTGVVKPLVRGGKLNFVVVSTVTAACITGAQVSDSLITARTRNAGASGSRVGGVATIQGILERDRPKVTTVGVAIEEHVVLVALVHVAVVERRALDCHMFAIRGQSAETVQRRLHVRCSGIPGHACSRRSTTKRQSVRACVAQERAGASRNLEHGNLNAGAGHLVREASQPDVLAFDNVHAPVLGGGNRGGLLLQGDRARQRLIPAGSNQVTAHAIAASTTDADHVARRKVVGQVLRRSEGSAQEAGAYGTRECRTRQFLFDCRGAANGDQVGQHGAQVGRVDVPRQTLSERALECEAERSTHLCCTCHTLGHQDIGVGTHKVGWVGVKRHTVPRAWREGHSVGSECTSVAQEADSVTETALVASKRVDGIPAGTVLLPSHVHVFDRVELLQHDLHASWVFVVHECHRAVGGDAEVKSERRRSVVQADASLYCLRHCHGVRRAWQARCRVGIVVTFAVACCARPSSSLEHVRAVNRQHGTVSTSAGDVDVLVVCERDNPLVLAVLVHLLNAHLDVVHVWQVCLDGLVDMRGVGVPRKVDRPRRCGGSV